MDGAPQKGDIGWLVAGTGAVIVMAAALLLGLMQLPADGEEHTLVAPAVIPIPAEPAPPAQDEAPATATTASPDTSPAR